MYIIEPLQITYRNGRLTHSNVPYPDVGLNPFLLAIPVSFALWVSGQAHAMGTVVIHFGGVYLCINAMAAGDTASLTPPGHVESMFFWARHTDPALFDAAVTYTEGAVVGFPAVSYATRHADTDPALPDLERYRLAAIPTFTPTGYPSGFWRRNATPDDGESLLPKYPLLASKYWDAMEPPKFTQLPEIPQGELTTYAGRVWRKRTPVMAAYEAPPSAPLDWALEKASNRFAMFDASVQSQTRQTLGSYQYPPSANVNEVISVEITPGDSIVDAIALLNLEATSVRVQVGTGTQMEIVYDKTASLLTSVVANNWYDWFFAERTVGQSLVFDDLPPVSNPVIGITITNAGGQAACGVCIVGKQTYIGEAQYGTTVGIKDYSLKNTDDFGNITIRKRAYSDRLTVPIRLHNDMLEPIKRLVTKYLTVPVLWVGSPGIPSTIVYGYYKEFLPVIAYPKESTCNLEIEGLT